MIEPRPRVPVPSSFVKDVTEKLRDLDTKLQARTEPPKPYGTLYQVAAVSSTFDQQLLEDMPRQEDEASLDDVQADCSVVLDSEGRVRWTLDPEVRIKVLRELGTRAMMAQARRNNPSPATDPVQHALDAYIAGSLNLAGPDSLSDLSSTFQVTEWLRSAGFADLPDRRDIEQKAALVALLGPFEHLASDHRFRGRSLELKRLRDYVGVLPPTSRIESLRRLVVERVLSIKEKPPLMVVGPGGVGKSTLIARFILEHARHSERERFPWVYLDFDRPDLRADESATLLFEAVRQLGTQYPAAQAQCDEIRRGWRARHQRYVQANQANLLNRSGPARAKVRSASFIADFKRLLSGLDAGDHPLLFVLDTFEEVQLRSDTWARGVWEFLGELQRAVPRLRTVLAGRAAVEGAEVLELKGLDEEAGIAFLLDSGFTDPAVARRVVLAVRGNPLSLRLAAHLASGSVKEGKPAEAELTGPAWLEFTDAQIQRYLYDRVLNHIKDPEVKALAHPGLVLRQLTPALILEVLAGPCGLAVTTLEEAKTLYQKIKREVSLVSPGHGEMLTHRQDLRVLMLGLIQDDQPRKTREIRERAVAFYASQEGPAARAEELYHRIGLEQEAATIEPRWMPGVEPFLAPALAELKGARRAFLASRLGLDIDEATAREAGLEDWERLTERRVNDLLAKGSVEEALRELGSRAERTATSPLFELEASARRLMHDADGALAALDRGLLRAAEEGNRDLTRRLATIAFDLLVDAGRQRDAARYLEALARTGRSGDRLDQLEVAVMRCLLGRLEEGIIADDPVVALFDATTDEEVETRPPLICRIGAVLGPGRMAQLARVIRLVGVPLSRGDIAWRELASQLAQFDFGYSKDLGEPPGVVARDCRLQVTDTLTETWAQAFISLDDTTVAGLLAGVVTGYPVSDPVLDSIATIYRIQAGWRGAESDSRWSPRTAGPDTKEFLRAARLRRVRPELVAGLVDGMGDIPALRDFLSYRLDRSLESVSTERDPRRVADAIVRAAEREGWLMDLVLRALESRPGEPRLASVAARLGLSTLADPKLKFFEPSDWMSRLGAIETQVARVVVGERMATGFLVGVDVLVTAASALAPVVQGQVRPGDVSIRFDSRWYEGHDLALGTVFRLHRDWQFAKTRPDDWFTLLRVRDSPGAQPVGGARVEPAARPRRWIEIPIDQKPPPVGSGLAVVHYARGRPMMLSHSASAVVGLSQDGRELHYSVAAPGMGGGPCFTSDLTLCGVHVGRRTLPDGRVVGFGVTTMRLMECLHDLGLEYLVSRSLA